MRRCCITLALLATSLWGQSVDLAGEWRRSADDQAAYSRPDFEDRAWETIRLPWRAFPPAGIYWLRRSVNLPPGLDPSQAAMTLGPVAEVLEVFVNGVRIAQTGVFHNRFAAHIAQSHTFAIPPEVLGVSPGRLQVAIRLERVFTNRGRMSSFSQFQDGSYVITEAASAPQRENEWLFTQRQLRTASHLATGPLLLASGLLFLLLWLYQPREMDLLFLALLAASRGAFDLLGYTLFAPDTYPGVGWTNLAHAVNGAALAQLILSATGLRSPWFRGGFWLLWALYYVLFLISFASIAGYVDVLAFAFLCFGWWRKTGGRADWSEWLTVGSLALAAMAHADAWFRFLDAQTWSPISTSMAILSGLLVFLTLRRLNQDRREKERLAGELEAARLVQNLLFSAPAEAPGLATVEAVYAPANEVGGDFHWTRLEPDGSLLAVVGDVSGKGLKAAMLVSVVIGILRNEKSSQPSAILAALNDGLTGHTGGGFVTCCCARFDADGTVTLASAGHPSPYADGRELEVSTGLPLGIAPGVAYDESTASGSRFTFVSDGVVEAENAQRELFGFDRTREISGKSAQEIAEAAQAWGQNDDITVVTVRRNV